MNDYIKDNTEIPADPQEERVPQTSTLVVAARSKAKAKPQPRVLVGTTATIPVHERRWIDIEPSEQNLASYGLSKKVINLIRHNQTLQRQEDEAIEFYKTKLYLRNHHSQVHLWSYDRWKLAWLQKEVRNEDISIALTIRNQFFTSLLFKVILEAISLILRYRTMQIRKKRKMYQQVPVPRECGLHSSGHHPSVKHYAHVLALLR